MPRTKIKTRWWVGRTSAKHHVAFALGEAPSSATHKGRYTHSWGPFHTKGGAEEWARVANESGEVLTITEAERRAKLPKGKGNPKALKGEITTIWIVDEPSSEALLRDIVSEVPLAKLDLQILGAPTWWNSGKLRFYLDKASAMKDAKARLARVQRVQKGQGNIPAGAPTCAHCEEPIHNQRPVTFRVEGGTERHYHPAHAKHHKG
jgi:hypothetical protein